MGNLSLNDLFYSLLPLTNNVFWCFIYCFCRFKVFILFTYLFSAVLGLWCCTDFSLVVASRSCSPGVALGLPTSVGCRTQALRRSGVRSWGSQAQQLQLPGSGAPAQWLGCTGLAASCLFWSSWIRNRIHVSCFGRQILYHWAAREALGLVWFLKEQLVFLSEGLPPCSNAVM